MSTEEMEQRVMPERSVKTGGVEGRIWIDGRGRTFKLRENTYIAFRKWHMVCLG